MNKTIIIFIAAIGMSVSLNAQSKKVVCDGNSCRIEDAANGNGYSVMPPVPESAIEPMAPAPRLKSLNGKTIALVGGSFMANVTHPELKRLILAECPTAKVYVLSEIGSAFSPSYLPRFIRELAARGAFRA